MPTPLTFDPDVLLLTPRQDRLHAVAAALGRVWPKLLLERISSPPQAAQLALRGRVRLMLIDAAAGHDAGAGLVHHLARWRPDLPVLVLTDEPSADAGPTRQARWDQLDGALQRGLALPTGHGSAGEHDHGGDFLLVDDDVASLHFLQSCLADLAELRVARSSADALRLARQQRPDLLLLAPSLGDGEGDGRRLLERLRGDPSLANVPVILLGGDADIAPPARALDLEPLDWLVKPLDAPRLRTRVQAAWRRGAHSSAGVAHGEHAGALRGACVLAVGADPHSLEALRLALASEGLRLLSAADTTSATALAAAEAPELVVIDTGRSGEDGFALAERLTALPAMAHVPLIFLTPQGDVAAEMRALGRAAFGFIGKPVVPAVLNARVRNALRLRRRAADARHVQQAEVHRRQRGGEPLFAIIANARDAIVALDAQGRVCVANEASHALLGHEGPGAPPAGRPLPAWLQQVLPADLLRGEQRRAPGLTLQPPGEAATEYDVAAAVLTWDDGPLVTLTFQDQTARIRAEQQAQRQTTLEAQGRAAQLMMSYLAHEIGNPLNGIIGLTRMLLAPGAQALSADQRRKLALMADSADMLDRLMGDALDLARWQVGRFSIDVSAVPVRDALEATLGTLAGLADRSGVTLAVPCGDMDVLVRADPHRLRQCLHNLVSNACKYGRPGGQVQVAVGTSTGDVEIAVSDDGQGLSPQQLARLFEPFERLGRQGPAGQGLGLAVTRMLAQAMAGRLEVDAWEGLGSRFTLVLPRHVD